jgi:hypothetical protein
MFSSGGGARFQAGEKPSEPAPQNQQTTKSNKKWQKMLKSSQISYLKLRKLWSATVMSAF